MPKIKTRPITYVQVLRVLLSDNLFITLSTCIFRLKFIYGLLPSGQGCEHKRPRCSNIGVFAFLGLLKRIQSIKITGNVS